MANATRILTSIYGRRLGLTPLSTGQSGGSKPSEFMAGPDGLLQEVTTAESTANGLRAHGVSLLPGTSAASSCVYTLDPPIPGIEKTLVNSSSANGPMYVKTKNGETIISTLGTTHTVLKSSDGGALRLVGLTTAIWAAIGLTSGTSSQASGWAAGIST